jgi:hypothetical protein
MLWATAHVVLNWTPKRLRRYHWRTLEYLGDRDQEYGEDYIDADDAMSHKDDCSACTVSKLLRPGEFGTIDHSVD